MEYGLWHEPAEDEDEPAAVLILVLMEYGLWQIAPIGADLGKHVLILVLMEYGLWLSTGFHLS